MENNILKISSKSEPGKIAGAITAMINENKKVELHAVGAAAINQAVKGIATARGFVATTGKNLVCIPGFTTVNIDNEDRTGMKFIVREER